MAIYVKPTKAALWHRKIIKSQEESICEWCKREVESDTHLLIHCKQTKRIWKVAGFNAREMQSHGTSVQEWWKHISQKYSQNKDMVNNQLNPQ